MNRLKILSLNIGNPSLERAKKQCEWILNRSEDVFVLTETKNSKGCQYIEDFFSYYGNDLFTMKSSKKYYVYFPKSKTGDLGVMVISKYEIQSYRHLYDDTSIFYTRHLETKIKINDRFLTIIGLYIPSRDRSTEKIERKKTFIENIQNDIELADKCNSIIIGDFNIIDRNHYPHYSNFFKWEYDFYDFLIDMAYIDTFNKCNPSKQDYSWVGRTANGYRYDYCFVTKDLYENIIDCYFVHETRKEKLTDHSAIFIELEFKISGGVTV